MKAGPVVFCILVIAAALAPLGLDASEAAASMYNQGNRLYSEGRFEEAASAYERVLAAGVRNADLYYNLGNACLKADRLGQAILSYSRGLRLKPRDPDLSYNLAYSRVLIKGKLPEVEETLVSRVVNGILERVSLDELTAGLSCFYILVFAGAIILVLRPGPGLRRLSIYLMVIGASGMIVVFPFFMTDLYREVLRETAIVMEEKVSAYSGPGEDNARLFDLYEGMEVTVRQSEGGFSRIDLKSGLSGWIPDGSYETIAEPPSLKTGP